MLKLSSAKSRADYPDQIIAYRPRNQGGARRRDQPAAAFTHDGQLTLNHEAAELLGKPHRVLISVNPRQGRIYLKPTTPTSMGGFALAGGGTSPHRIGARQLMKDFPLLAGKYKVQKSAEGLVLILDDGEEPE